MSPPDPLSRESSVDTTHAIVEVEAEYTALLSNPRRPLTRFVDVGLVYARMVADLDPDRAFEVLGLALDTLHDPPAAAEAAPALQLIRSQRDVARRLGRLDIELGAIDRERRMISLGLVSDGVLGFASLARRAATVRFERGEVAAGFAELVGALEAIEHVDRDQAIGSLADIATDLVVAIRRYRVPSTTMASLEQAVVRLRSGSPDGLWTSWCLVVLAALRLEAADTVSARLYLRRVMGHTAEVPLVAVLVAGWTAGVAGDHQRSYDYFHDALTHRTPDERLRQLIAAGLGETLVRMGRVDEARAHLAEAIAYDVGDPLSTARCHELLADIAADEGRFDEAYQHLRLTRSLEQQATLRRDAEWFDVSRLSGFDGEPPVVDLRHVTESSGPLEVDGAIAEWLAAGRFRLHLQPICSNEHGQPNAAEALLRLDHPERGLLAPADFLRGAPVRGDLGAWVLACVCDTLRRWHDDGLAMRISVNVSGEQLGADFVDLVRTAVVGAGIRPDDLILEFKEEVLTAASDDELGVLDELQSIGVRIGIDNFGLGPESFDLLFRFPVDLVKVDRHAIERVARSHLGRRDLESLMAISDSFGFEVVAEGVESIEQFEFQRELGCHGVQGFLIAGPTPVEGFAAVVDALHVAAGLADGSRAA